MSQRPNTHPLPEHPAVNRNTIVTMVVGGHSGPAAEVTCPFCQQTRRIAVRTLRHQMAHVYFTGACKPCWSSQPKARTFRNKRNPSGRRTEKSGYVSLGKNAISDIDLPMWYAMKGKGGMVLEHRWVMAKYLGRPLTTREMVDHLDGVKAHNGIANLRLYVRGKNQQGSCPGHGTYYHEWQMAERRIRELEHRL